MAYPSSVTTYTALASGKALPFDVVQSYQDEITAIETDLLARVRCQVYNNATQSIGTGAFTTLTFNSEDHDTAGMHSTSSNTGRITIPTGMGGTYLLSGVTSWAANATGIRQIQIVKNGVTTVGTRGLVLGFSSGGVGPTVSTEALVALSAGDYVELQAYQDSGGNLNAGNAARELSSQFFAARML